MYPPEEIILPTVKEDDLADLPPVARQFALNQYSRHDLLVSTGNWRFAVQAYLAAITFADARVGRLLDAFDKSPHRDNTVVVLWSDHGYHLGEKWRWHKQALWRRATHVPFLMVAPGLTRPATRCAEPADLTAVYPTLVDVAGLPAKEGLDGQSLRPLIENPSVTLGRTALSTYLRGNHAVTGRRWRCIRYHDGSEELYGRLKDPQEWVNLARRAGYAQHKQELAGCLPPRDAPDAPWSRDYRPDTDKVRWLPKGARR